MWVRIRTKARYARLRTCLDASLQTVTDGHFVGWPAQRHPKRRGAACWPMKALPVSITPLSHAGGGYRSSGHALLTLKKRALASCVEHPVRIANMAWPW